MITELRIRGTIGQIQFLTYISGPDVAETIFYEDTPHHVRFFSSGNEFIIADDEIRYRGYGGSFCEYMFGVDKPMEDTVRKEIVNRLVMFGAYTDDKGGVVFTDNVEGRESFYKLFLQGNAVTNYYFLVSSDYQGNNKKRQKDLLMAVGKYLKRTPLNDDPDDTELVKEFRDALNEKKATVFIIKLVHKNDHEFYSAFRDFYLDDRFVREDRQKVLNELIHKKKIEEYQVERIKIDVMYKHPENKVVVDEYRDILINAVDRDNFQSAEMTKLRRLRTLAIRNNMPAVLFDTLDNRLMKGKKIYEEAETDYLKEARGILETVFFKDPTLKKHIIKEDIVRLLRTKHMAHEKSDMGFERIVLDAGKMCDDIVRETNDFSVFEELSGILTYFDRYDNVSSLLNNIAFTEKVDITKDTLRSLVGNIKEFAQLQSGLFEELFITKLMSNKYLTSFGKKKVDTTFRGLKKIITGDASVQDVLEDLSKITDGEKAYKQVLQVLKEKMKDVYPRLDSREEREEVRKEIEADLSAKRILRRIPAEVFEKAVIDIKKEVFYVNHVLPRVIKDKDMQTREDFLQNSGIDRFYIETLEREHLKSKGMPYSVIEEIVTAGASSV